MFGTIRKHQTWLWVIIIGVMVVSMATFTQMNRSDNQRGAGAHGEIDGKPITDAEFQNAWNETMLTYFMRNREFPETTGTRNGWNQEQQTYERLFLIRKLEQYNIRADSDSAATVGGLFLRELGRGETVSMTAFETQVLAPHQLTSEDFRRFLEHYVAIQQLVSVIGASGALVPPAEVESLYVQGHQEVMAQVVIFSASNYLATIPEPTPAFVGQYYTNEEANYREPDRMQVNYVHFNITNYLADAEKQLGTNINSQVEDVLHREGTNALTLGKTEAEQRAKIHEYLIRGVALSNAYYAALSFQKSMNQETPHAEDLNALAREKGMEVKTSKPFDKQYGPSDLDLPPNYPVSELFNLTADEPFVATPLRAEDGVYILAFNKFIPSRVPPLDEIHSRVVADAKEFEAMHNAQMSARMFQQTATNGLAKGQTFAEITSAARVKPVDLPAFSVSTESLPLIEDEVADLNSFKQSVMETPAGKVSGLIPTRTGAMLVYVRERLPVDKTKMQADLANFGKMVRQARQNQAFDMWFAKEFNEAARTIPALQQQQRRS